MSLRFFFTIIISIMLVILPVIWLTHNEANAGKKEVGTLEVKVIGFESDKGQLCVDVFTSSEGFPMERAKAFKKSSKIITKKTSSVIIKNLPYGKYAVMAFHDEDNNKVLKTNFIGMPKEGQGVSNNVEALIGPPSYEDAMFDLNSKKKSIQIKLKYL